MLAGMPTAELAEQKSIARPAALLGDRWTLVILRQAFNGTKRFEDFQGALGISRSLLSERLGRLVKAGVLRREPYKDEVRTRDRYRLTQMGLDLYPSDGLRKWGDRYLAEDGPPSRCATGTVAASRRSSCSARSAVGRSAPVTPRPSPVRASGPRPDGRLLHLGAYRNAPLCLESGRSRVAQTFLGKNASRRTRWEMDYSLGGTVGRPRPAWPRGSRCRAGSSCRPDRVRGGLSGVAGGLAT